MERCLCVSPSLGPSVCTTSWDVIDNGHNLYRICCDWDPGVMQHSSPPSHLPLLSLSLSLSLTHTHTQTCIHTSLHVLESHSLHLFWGNNSLLSRHNRKKQEDNSKMFGRDLFAFCDKLGRELRLQIIGNHQVPRI